MNTSLDQSWEVIRFNKRYDTSPVVLGGRDWGSSGMTEKDVVLRHFAKFQDDRRRAELIGMGLRGPEEAEPPEMGGCCLIS